METKDYIKLVVLLFLYLMAGPALGFILRAHRALPRIAFGLMVFMTISGLLSASEWGLSIHSLADYRGHARGFHFYFNEVLAIALLTATALNPKRKLSLLPPGLILYSLYVGLSFLSILNAPVPLYTLFAAFKAIKVVLIFLAAFNFIREEEDIAFFLNAMGWTMIWEMMVVLKMKYVDRIYQIYGTFEHQNSLSMYATMIGMVLLAVGAGPEVKGRNFWLFCYLATAVIVQSSLSRAGLVIFAAATVGVMGLSFLDRFTKRRGAVLGVLSLAAVVGLSMTFTTIMNRFNDHYNSESKQTRIQLNQASKLMLKDYSLGIGWNNFAHAINKPFPYGDHIDAYFKSHGETVDPKYQKGIVESHYYLLLSETGYQGYLSYMLFILVFLWMNLRGMLHFRGTFLGPLSFGIAMGCGANYLQSMYERVLTQPRNMMLWMMLLAIASRVELLRRRKKQVETPRATQVPRRRQAVAS